MPSNSIEGDAVAPDRLPCTAEAALHETQDGFTKEHLSSISTPHVSPPARLWEKLPFGML